ncbi:MAG: fasciclin domain-containing protein [Anaerolineae bacterium]
MLKDLVTTAIEDGRFGRLLLAIGQAGLAEQLSEIDGITIFAPIDQAFVRLASESPYKYNADVTGIRELLLSHVVKGRVTFADLRTLKRLETMRGNIIEISCDPDVVRIGGSQVLVADIVANNGIIHIIDRVLPITAIARADYLAF